VRSIDDGVGSILDSYNDALAKLNDMDSTAQILDGQISDALVPLNRLIDEHACVGEKSLRQGRQLLQDAQAALKQIQTFVDPVLAQLNDFDVNGKANEYDARPLLVIALLVPSALALLGVLVELVSLLFRWACPEACGRSGGGGCCLGSCCLRLLSMLLLGLSASILVATTGLYWGTALVGADFCAAPDANIGLILDKAGVDPGSTTRDLINFYSLCRSSQTVTDFQQQLEQGKAALVVLPTLLSKWGPDMCPQHSQELSDLVGTLQDAWPLYQQSIYPLHACTYLQPFYCEGVGEGLCQDVAVGAAKSLVAQTSLFVSMLLCMAFAGWVARELRKQPKQTLREPLLAPRGAAYSSNVAVTVQPPPPVPPQQWQPQQWQPQPAPAQWPPPQGGYMPMARPVGNA